MFGDYPLPTKHINYVLMNWATCINYVLILATNTYVLFHLIYEAKFPLMGNSIRGLARILT